MEFYPLEWQKSPSDNTSVSKVVGKWDLSRTTSEWVNWCNY